jgi:hypothetical protein
MFPSSWHIVVQYQKGDEWTGFMQLGRMLLVGQALEVHRSVLGTVLVMDSPSGPVNLNLSAKEIAEARDYHRKCEEDAERRRQLMEQVARPRPIQFSNLCQETPLPHGDSVTSMCFDYGVLERQVYATAMTEAMSARLGVATSGIMNDTFFRGMQTEQRHGHRNEMTFSPPPSPELLNPTERYRTSRDFIRSTPGIRAQDGSLRFTAMSTDDTYFDDYSTSTVDPRMLRARHHSMNIDYSIRSTPQTDSLVELMQSASDALDSEQRENPTPRGPLPRNRRY